MTGKPAFSAAGHNQSVAPLSRSAACARWSVSRTPSMPGCFFQSGSKAADSGFSTGMRPITANRLGYRFTASSP